MSWTETSIDSLCVTVTSGGTPSRSRSEYWENGTIPWLKTGELNDGIVYDAEEKITKSGLVNSSAKIFPINTVLMAMYGDGKTITTLSILGHECATNQACAAMIANPDICDYRFLFYALMLHRSKFLSLVVAGAQRNLSLGIVKKFSFPVPDLPTQQRIAGILSAYDDLIENNRRRIALLEQAARLLYREWFVHLRFPGHETVKIVDGLPEGWTTATFDVLCETIGGGTPSTKNPEFWEDGDVTWVTPTDITRKDCLALLGSEKKITSAGLKHSSAKLVPPNTILMTSRASVGFFGLADFPVSTNQGFINVVPHNETMRYYLLFNLLHRVDEIRGHASGATYAEISKGKFRALPVVVPSERTAARFYSEAEKIINQVRTIAKQNAKLTRARDLLLPRLMDGRIPV